MDGLLIVNKPRGLTSHDAVAQVRRMARQKRVGHAGTLDPLAQGVLVVCLGQATRLSEYLMSSPKTYRATIRLGQETDTYDAEGRIVAERSVKVDRMTVEDVLMSFVGLQQQMPPMFSAVQVQGQRLYKLARRGVVIERPPRAIEVFGMVMLDWQPPNVTYEVRCSAGTYVRTLAHDIGERLGTGAYLAALVRTVSGPFRLESAWTLDHLRELFAAGRGAQALLPLSAALEQFPVIHLSTAEAGDLRYGRAISMRAEHPHAPMAQARGSEGEIVALVSLDSDKALWRPHKVFEP